MRPSNLINQRGGAAIMVKSRIPLGEFQNEGILFSGPGMRGYAGIYSDDPNVMAGPWEKYMNDVYFLDSMESHQEGGDKASKIDSMLLLDTNSIEPHEIKYSTHNTMRFPADFETPVSFFTTQAQIECLNDRGMVLHPITNIWWPTAEATPAAGFAPVQDLQFSKAGYFLVGRIWHSHSAVEPDEVLTAQWVKISYRQLYDYFDWPGKPS